MIRAAVLYHETPDGWTPYGPGTRRYPGTCRDGLPAGREARAWRLRVAPGVVSFDDAVQGPVEEDVAADVGDFVLLRADGLPWQARLSLFRADRSSVALLQFAAINGQVGASLGVVHTE